MQQKSEGDKFIKYYSVVIPWPVIRERVSKAKNEDAYKADGSWRFQAFQHPPETKTPKYVDKHLRLYQGDHLGAENFEKEGRNDPEHVSEWHAEIPERYLPVGHPVCTFPGEVTV